jgi:hypothetical protein
MQKTYLIILFVAFGVISLIIYNKLGGFKEINVEKIELSPLRLKGLYFKGTPIDPALEATFQEVHHAANQTKESSLYTLYLIEPAGKTDTMHVFVGLENLKNNLPEHWEELNFPEGTYLSSFLEAHPLVMPSPQKVKEAINSYSENNKITKPKIFIEKIQNKNQVQVLAPID